MQIGVGLPTTVPGADGATVIEWARRAEAGPFASLGVLDRLVYDSYDPLIALAAAAAVTQRVRLATTIVIGPLHNTALLAKMAASLDALAGGRLVLGLAVGARDGRLRGRRGGLRQPRAARLPSNWPPCARSGKTPAIGPRRPGPAARRCSSAG